MLDRDAFVERAAIMEFDGGLSRFEAETQAAKAQGMTRWEALEAIRNADSKRNPAIGGDHGSAHVGNGSDDVSRVQRGAEEQGGSVSIGVVPAGRRGVELLALRA